MNKRYNNDEIIALHSQGLSDAEIAKKIGCTPNQMAKKRKSLGLEPNCMRDTYQLSERELAIVIGTLLGDACIRYVHSKCKYPMLNFSHCVQQEEYFLYKKDQLINLMASFNKYYHTDKERDSWQFNGKNMACLKELREIFYPNNIKILPLDYLKLHFTEESIYYWYMDDGCYDKHTNSFTIATDCFDREQLQNFIDWLNEKFNLDFSIKKDGELYLKHKSNETFYNIISKYNKCESMQYKYILCSSRKTPLNGETPEMDNPVLNLQETEENA